MNTLNSILLAGVVAVSSGAGAARAADMLPVDFPPIYSDVPEMQPVEIGNGWYLRGDVSYDFESETGRDYSVYSPFTGDDWFGGEATIDPGHGLQLGVGHQFTDYLRGDVTARYAKADVGRQADLAFCIYGTDCTLDEAAETTRWEVMGNAYVDLGTVSGFTPYVGAGAGAVQVDYEKAGLHYCDNDYDFGGETACVDYGLESEKDWRFAYSLMAGLSYDVSQALKLDLGYRFLDVDGGDAVTIEDTETGVGIKAEDDGFQLHTIQAGFRYSLF